MMDTILNLGLNDETVVALANLTGNERFAYDSYRRFIQMFSDVVMEVEKAKFDVIFDGAKKNTIANLTPTLLPTTLRKSLKHTKPCLNRSRDLTSRRNP